MRMTSQIGIAWGKQAKAAQLEITEFLTWGLPLLGS